MTNRLTIAVNVDLSANVVGMLQSLAAEFGYDIVFTKSLDELHRVPTIVFGGASAEYIATHPELKWVQTASAGVDSIFMSGVHMRRDVIVTNARGVYGVAGGEHVMAMMLHFARGFDFYFANQRRGQWVRDIDHARVLHGQTLLLLGLGDLGGHVARRARAFGMHVVAVRRSAKAHPDADRVVTVDELDDVLPLAHHLAVTLPLTEETEGLLNARRLALLPEGAYVYNIGRGPIIVEEDLLEALRSDHVAGAGLDVFTQEPLPEGHPFWKMDNVIMTPHIGADTPWDMDRAADVFADNLRRYARGEALVNVVDPTLGY